MLAGLIVLALIGAWLTPRPQGPPRSSESTGLDGYAALHDLLVELRFGEELRGYTALASVPSERVPWYLEPAFLHTEELESPRETDGDEREDEDETADAEEDEPLESRDAVPPLLSEILSWTSEGRTAVILGGPFSTWEPLGLVATKTRPRDGYEALAGFEDDPPPLRVETLRAQWSERGRALDASRLRVFERLPDGARVLAVLDGAPFVVELSQGTGRIVAVADSRFMNNARIGRHDGALVAADLVRALGVPWLDERAHGSRADVSIFDVLGPLRTALLLGAALAVALLVALERRRWPARELWEPEGPEPTLSAFVESLGALYARSGDHAAIFAAYRYGFLHRWLRGSRSRHAGDTGAASMAVSEAEPVHAPTSRAELERAVRGLERSIEERAERA